MFKLTREKIVILIGFVLICSLAATIRMNRDAIQLHVTGYSTQTTPLAVFDQADGTDVFTVTNDGLATSVANANSPFDVAITAGNYTVTSPTKSDIHLTCAAGGGCGLVFSDTGAVDGMIMTFTNEGTNTITASESTGLLEGTSTLGQFDTLVVKYVSDRYIKVGGSDN